jgi:hypothetical protein
MLLPSSSNVLFALSWLANGCTVYGNMSWIALSQLQMTMHVSHAA